MTISSQPTIDENRLANPSAMSLGAQIIGKLGTLEVRLTTRSADIEAAQSLRYRVFVEEMGALLPQSAMILKRDIDHYDNICHHLLVVDNAIKGDLSDQIVGTYRLLTQNRAQQANGFYSQSEYDVQQLINRHQDKKFLELGRSCVLPHYRNKRSIELLWQGIWAFALEHKIDAMFGCASFPGTIPAAHAKAMAFLYHNMSSDQDWQVSAHPDHACSMDFMPQEAISMKQALSSMPPLIKAYMRLGARFSPDSVVDHAFNTSDVFVMLPVDHINPRYIDYYGADAMRFVA